MVAVAEPVPWRVTAVESRGGAWLRISHEDGTVADHELTRLLGRDDAFAELTWDMVAEARVDHGTVGWVIDGAVVDLAPDGLWDHAHGRCGGGGCTGWTLEQTVVVALPRRMRRSLGGRRRQPRRETM